MAELSSILNNQEEINEEFSRLPNPVQEIALKKISISRNATELIWHLDRCDELRVETETPEGFLVKEVDLINRYYQVNNDN